MATMKERPGNWKARGLIKRDFQHDHSGPEELPHSPRKKNKKWCKGKEGKVCEFTVKTMKWSSAHYRTYTMSCPVCHKQQGYFTSRLVEYTYTINGEEHTRKYWT